MFAYTHAVLMSGGLDSTVVLKALTSNPANKVRAVHIDGGNASALHQLHFTKSNCNDLGVPLEIIEMRGLQGLMAGYVPPEFAGIDDFDSRCPYDGSVLPLLIASAAYHCQVSQTPVLEVGLTKEQAHANTRPFLKTLGQAMSLFDPRANSIVIDAPLLDLTKSEVVSQGVGLGVKFENTWSCFLNGRHHCGVCGPCIDRKAAFLGSQVPDPTTYLA
jgi:7-cyano-7-deazaguanine synthase